MYFLVIQCYKLAKKSIFSMQHWKLGMAPDLDLTMRCQEGEREELKQNLIMHVHTYMYHTNKKLNIKSS